MYAKPPRGLPRSYTKKLSEMYAKVGSSEWHLQLGAVGSEDFGGGDVGGDAGEARVDRKYFEGLY